MRLFWLGDQLVTWDAHDGIKTALIGLLSSGLSGFSLNHSDTGGYTAVDNFTPFYKRSKELLKRWTEMNAFTAVLRTHEGNVPTANEQVYSDADDLAHFAKFARVYKALAPYRRKLMAEAAATGMPLVRSLFLHYPQDPATYNLTSEFLLGPDLLIVPVLDPGVSSVTAYFPEPGWTNLVTGEVMPVGTSRVAAPIGKPAVFFLQHDLLEHNWLVEVQHELQLD